MTITITGLPLQGTVLDATLIPVETSGVTAHITASSIKNYISSATLTTLSAGTGTITGALTADSMFTVTLGASGQISADSLSTVRDVVVGGNLTVNGSGPAVFASGISTSENATLGDTDITGNVTISGNASIGNVTAVIRTANQPYITSLGNISLSGITVSSNITVGSAIVPSSNTSVTLGNVSNWYSNVYAANSTFGNVTATTKVTAGGFFFSNGVAVSAAINLSSYAGNVGPSANLTYNLGSTTNWWNKIYGTSSQALYADLAEKYQSDAQYTAGTVLIFGDKTEVTISTHANDTRVAGVVSTNPAYLMNGGIEGVEVALQGRVPCQVTGTVKRGDLMVSSSIPGVAMTNNEPKTGSVIGKALGSYSGDGVGIIEVVVGRF
jgi:trimeric autotransporter adhesin